MVGDRGKEVANASDNDTHENAQSTRIIQRTTPFDLTQAEIAWPHHHEHNENIESQGNEDELEEFQSRRRTKVMGPDEFQSRVGPRRYRDEEEGSQSFFKAKVILKHTWSGRYKLNRSFHAITAPRVKG